MDALGESLHNRASQLEELAGRLKEFEEGRQAVERRLEAAKHQIEVQEALGPQVLKKTVLIFLFYLNFSSTGQTEQSYYNNPCAVMHESMFKLFFPFRLAAPRAWRG